METTITGKTLLARLRFLDERLGASGAKKVLGKLPPEDQKLLGGIVLPVGRYPLLLSDRLDKAIAILDATLAQRAWMGGKTFTMADCVIAPGVHRYLNLPGERAAAPNIERYHKQLMQRPVAKQLLTLPLT